MKFFVLYADGYWDDGNIGTEECASAQEAAGFISARLAKAAHPDLANYRVIEGVELTLSAVEYAKRIEVKRV